MKKVILAAFVSGLFLSTVVSRAKTISVTGLYATAINDTDTTKKVGLAATNDDIVTNIRTVVNDTDTTKKKITADAVTANDDVKTKIDPAALPDAVKTVLAGDEYKGWLIANAYEVKGSVTYYEIELKKGDSKNTVKLDKEGKKV